jgi:thiol-disulfide isomerase/thioredoxin
MKVKLTAYCLLSTVYCLAQIQQGNWFMTLQLNDSTELPFNFEVTSKGIDIKNAEERIHVDEITYADDSVFIRMPVFDSEFRMQLQKGGTKLRGYFLNYARLDKNQVPAVAYYSRNDEGVRSSGRPVPFNLTGRWEVRFAGDAPPLDLSIGEFKQDTATNNLTGTFLTSTGDYRYLQGQVMGDRTGNSFFLAAFNGFHLFYFTGNFEKDGTIKGHFYSGMHWHDTWTAKRNEKAQLLNPDSLTFLKQGYDKLSFAFPDLDSNLVSLSDKKFLDKVIIVQIMGTWCPNCLDETQFLAPFYLKNKERGLEIIGLDYERIANFSTAKRNLLRLKKQYDIDYTLLFAGSTNKAERVKTLPMLSDIIAFPTTIYIDRKGRVRKIHTGFSGPATGMAYEKWKEDFTLFIDKLLKEN